MLEEFASGGGNGEGGGNGGGGGGDATGGGGDGELQTEYNRQREHLERNVEALKRNIAKDVEMCVDLSSHAVFFHIFLPPACSASPRRRRPVGRRCKKNGVSSRACPGTSTTTRG